jgi:hypothetical protein
LVQRAIQDLKDRGLSISISAIVSCTKALDPDDAGVSQSALLNNPEARSAYEKNRNWLPKRSRRENVIHMESPYRVINNTIDVASARRRLHQLTKGELITRLLDLERVCARLQSTVLAAQAAEVTQEWEALQRHEDHGAR